MPRLYDMVFCVQKSCWDQVPPTYVTESPKASSLHNSGVDDVSSTDVDDTDNDPDYATSSISSTSKVSLAPLTRCLAQA